MSPGEQEISNVRIVTINASSGGSGCFRPARVEKGAGNAGNGRISAARFVGIQNHVTTTESVGSELH